MTISSSLNAGVMGLSVNATRLATISDNVANSGTVGYKRATADFLSMVLNESAAAFSAGGVRVQTSRLVSEEGALFSTGRSTDIAMAGPGFLPTTQEVNIFDQPGERPLLLSSTGSFRTDERGYLITPGGSALLGWEVNADGEIGSVARRSGIDLVPVNINTASLAAEPTTAIDLGLNLPASATEAGSSGDAYTLPVEAFDNLGRVQQIDLVFTPTVPGSGFSNQWTMEIFDQSVSPAVSRGTMALTFNDDPVTGGTIDTAAAGGGASYNASTGEVSFSWLSVGNDITINIGRPGEQGAISQFSSDFRPSNVVRNGAPAGDFSRVEIDEQGRLEAIYDTGFRRYLYQVPVVDVPNPDGLAAADNQNFKISQESGDFFLHDAGDGSAGAIVGFALQESTTDLGTELTDLIRTQRAYASNANVIRTVDEMLQETTNILR